MMQPGGRPFLSRTFCIGLTSFLIGTGLGIGMGVLITRSRYSNTIGGGIWFGKRRKRSLENRQSHVLQAIEEAKLKYNSNN